MVTSVDERLFARLDELAQRAKSLNEELAQPDVAVNPHRSIAITRELGRLRRIIEPYTEFQSLRRSLNETQALVADKSQDADFRALAEEEVEEIRRRHDALLDRLKSALVTDEDAAIKSIILEIRAGTGGDEAALFARDLYEMYKRFCDRKGLTQEVLDLSGSDIGGLKEVVFSVKGEDAYRLLGYEGGGHRVQRVPDTEAQGRIHTSAATVAVLPEPDEINIEVNWETEVEEFVSRAGGPGGQNVNKVSSAIRLVHKASGITVSMRDEKSQHKNRAKGRRLMLTRLYELQRSQSTAARDQARRTMIGSGDRSQRIRTYNFPQNRLTDHRIGLDLYCLDRVMQGDLDELVEALQTHDREQRLKQL